MQPITYRELQAKLRAMKEQGHELQVKLNAKHEILLQEFSRITQVLEDEVQASATCSLQVLDTRSTQAVEETSHQLPAMNAALVPSWLAKEHRVYIIDGVDYLPYELNAMLDGSYCRFHEADSELTCEYQASIVDSAPSSVLPTVLAKPIEVEDVAPTPSINDHLRKNYVVQQDVTVQQAVANLAQGLRNTRAFFQGFMEGLSASGRAKLRG
jgi:hypothetical protein